MMRNYPHLSKYQFITTVHIQWLPCNHTVVMLSMIWRQTLSYGYLPLPPHFAVDKFIIYTATDCNSVQSMFSNMFKLTRRKMMSLFLVFLFCSSYCGQEGVELRGNKSPAIQSSATAKIGLTTLVAIRSLIIGETYLKYCCFEGCLTMNKSCKTLRVTMHHLSISMASEIIES